MLRLAAEPANLAPIRRFIEAHALARGADPGSAADLVQAVDESVTNIIQHGYRGRPGVVEVEVGGTAVAMVVRLRDDAPAFDPTGVPAVDLEVPIERRPLGGMGVHLTRELTDEMRYASPPGWKNELVLVKRIGSQAKRRG